MSPKTIDPDLLAAMRQVTSHYIKLREGTPAHLIKTQLGKKRHLLEEASRDGYLLWTGPRYFPCYPALELESSGTRESVQQWTTVVLRALKALYERDGDRMCDDRVTLEMCIQIDPAVAPEAVSVGMFFAKDFQLLVHLWNWKNLSDEHGSVNLATSDRLLDFHDLPTAWNKELKSRAKAAAPAAAARSDSPRAGSPPLVFETTGETYTSEGIEGEGGAGRVFRVVDSAEKRWALKCLRPEQATAVRTKRFLNELNFCSSCSHPNVVKVVDQGFIIHAGKKCPFYVMPLYPSTLRKLLSSGLPVEKAMRFFLEILDGVEAAHLIDVWHRDLKPENILHDPTVDRFLVSDFGIARFTAEEMYTIVETQPGKRLANFLYAAPEQRRAEAPVDQRTDIYALGLMLNELFTGQVPQGAGFKRIGQASHDFSYLDDLVDEMIQQDPEKRPTSIQTIKLRIIAGGQEFVRLQDLNKLKTAVIPETTIDDPILQNPIELVDIDYSGGMLKLKLNQAPNSGWVQAFCNMPGYSAIMGKEPSRYTFVEDEAKIEANINNARLIVGHFQNYLREANRLYVTTIAAARRQQIEHRNHELRESLKRAQEEEQTREYIRRTIKL